MFLRVNALHGALICVGLLICFGLSNPSQLCASDSSREFIPLSTPPKVDPSLQHEALTSCDRAIEHLYDRLDSTRSLSLDSLITLSYRQTHAVLEQHLQKDSTWRQKIEQYQRYTLDIAPLQDSVRSDLFRHFSFRVKPHARTLGYYAYLYELVALHQRLNCEHFQTLQGPCRWRNAIIRHMMNIERNGQWIAVDDPDGHHATVLVIIMLKRMLQ